MDKFCKQPIGSFSNTYCSEKEREMKSQNTPILSLD